MENKIIQFRGLPLSYVKAENGEYIAVRPICQALGIVPQTQIEKIKEHPIFQSTATDIIAVGLDKKERKMFSLPIKFVFGWLLSIDSRKVNEDSKDNLVELQLECYEVIYKHFFADIKEEIKLLEKQEQLKDEADKTKKRLKELQFRRRHGDTHLFQK